MSEIKIEGIHDDDKCPFCQSTNIKYLSTDTFSEKFEKHEDRGNVHYTENGSYRYPLTKSVCLTCGLVSEKMPNKVILQYQKEKINFK